jgi:hypothetical protein
VRHVRLKHVGRRLGRPLPPQLVDQPLGRDDLVRVQQQKQEQRALLGGAHGKYLRPFARDLERPEDSKLDHNAFLALFWQTRR